MYGVIEAQFSQPPCAKYLYDAADRATSLVLRFFGNGACGILKSNTSVD